MKSFFRDIKNQSRLTREIMFVLCVVITVSLVGSVWYRSTEEQLFVTLNPDEQKQQEFFAERKNEESTIMASFGGVWGGLKATIGSTLGLLGESEVQIDVEGQIPAEPHPLPISADK